MFQKPPALGVAIIGHGFMAAVHSQAWRTVAGVFDPPSHPRMTVLCGHDRVAAQSAALRLGWADAADDWRDVIHRDDVDIVDVCVPGDMHAEVAIAALKAGKHVLCEKPLANSVSEAVAMAAAAERASTAGVRSMVGFNYRRVPAIALARELVQDGRLGTIRHVRTAYLQDWLCSADHPMVWRLERARAGSGALGDLGAHIVDLAEFVAGQRLTGVAAMTETFVGERPISSSHALRDREPGSTGSVGRVDVDDCAMFFGTLAGGAVATFEATRFAMGRKNALRLEINGSQGSIAFDFEAMNELHLYDTRHGDLAGFRRILVTEPTHPYLSRWWPPGHGLGYEHTFTNQMFDMLSSISAGTDPEPSFADGLHVQEVLAAVERSASDRSIWTEVGR